LGLNAESAKFLDSSSGGSFVDLTLNEGRVILEKILANISYTGIYDEFPEEPPEMQPEEPSIEIPEPKDATPLHNIPSPHRISLTQSLSQSLNLSWTRVIPRVSSLSISMTSFSMTLGMPQINP
jgi:hypothetical protein